MFELVMKLLIDFLGKATEELEKSGLSYNIMQNIFKLENVLSGYVIDYKKIYFSVSVFSIGLLIFTYLKKGFAIYIVGNEGDDSLSPSVHFSGLIKVIVVIVGFNDFLDIGILMLKGLVDSIFPDITKTMLVIRSLRMTFDAANPLTLILHLLVVIFFMLLFFQFITRSVELFILRIGAPIAAIGILNADQGLWNMYFKKIVQLIITMVLQSFLMCIGYVVLFGNGGIPSLLTGLAILSTGLKLSSFLSDLIVMPSPSNSMGKLHSAAMLVNAIKSIVSRG